LLNTSTFEFIHPDDIESTARELEKLNGGEPTVNFLQRFKTSDGQYKTIQWTSTPETATGNIFGIGRDVTEMITLEKEPGAYTRNAGTHQ
jgi:PAS domain S-box-containing protein